MNYFYWIMQSLFAPLVCWIIKRSYKIEFAGKENLRALRPPLIIASNHKTLFDGFLIIMLLPFGSRILPLRFMIENFRFKGKKLELLRKLGMISFFRIIAGGIKSGRGTGIENAIQFPLKILKTGGTVLMFPEGYLIKEEALGYFFHGTSALALASGAPILPIFIKLKNKNIFVSAGKAFILSDVSREEGTEKIKLAIKNLSDRLNLD